MKALFLAGGNGTRLYPLTENVPKPMVPIMNKPLLERTMMNLKQYGISEMVISSCYKPQYITNHFGDGKDFGLDIQYFVEDFPMGTGGAIKNTESQFNDTFVIFNSDVLIDIDIKKMLDFHKSRQALVTIAVTEVEDPTMYGVIDADRLDYAVSFKEKPNREDITSNYINAGIYIFEPEVLRQIPSDSVVSIERETFPKVLATSGKIAVYKNRGYWMDIGTPEKYLRAHKDILDKKGPLYKSYFKKNNIITEENAIVHPRAVLEGSVILGDNVRIGPGAYLADTVVGSNVSIGAESEIVGSVIWDNVNISKNVRLYSTIVLSGSTVIRDSEYSKAIITNKLNQRIAI